MEAEDRTGVLCGEGELALDGWWFLLCINLAESWGTQIPRMIRGVVASRAALSP